MTFHNTLLPLGACVCMHAAQRPTSNLPQVARLQHVQVLDLSRSGVDAFHPCITDAGIAALTKAPRLQSLLLLGHAGLTNATAALLWCVALLWWCLPLYWGSRICLLLQWV